MVWHRWLKLSEVETYVDIAVMYALLVPLFLLGLAILLTGLLPH
jgi:hypothetical protein